MGDELEIFCCCCAICEHIFSSDSDCDCCDGDCFDCCSGDCCCPGDECCSNGEWCCGCGPGCCLKQFTDVMHCVFCCFLCEDGSGHNSCSHLCYGCICWESDSHSNDRQRRRDRKQVTQPTPHGGPYVNQYPSATTIQSQPSTNIDSKNEDCSPQPAEPHEPSSKFGAGEGVPLMSQKDVPVHAHEPDYTFETGKQIIDSGFIQNQPLPTEIATTDKDCTIQYGIDSGASKSHDENHPGIGTVSQNEVAVQIAGNDHVAETRGLPPPPSYDEAVTKSGNATDV